VPEEGYSRKASCALIYISMITLKHQRWLFDARERKA